MTVNGRTRIIERLYAALAYTGAVAILAIGSALIVRAMQREIVCAMWQIVLGCMAVPVLAAAAWSCGNYRENARVRVATSVVFMPLGLINPLMWLCALVIILRHSAVTPARARTILPRPLLHFRHVRPVRQRVELHIEECGW
jgi:hypothetical protein